MLLLLAAFHIVCAAFLGTIRGADEECRLDAGDSTSTREIIRRAPYLGLIAVLVLARTGAATMLDYMFKAGAGQVVGKGAPLLRFFAIFYTAAQILTFAAQAWLAKPALRRFGIGKTLAALPVTVGAGAVGVLLIPAVPVLASARAAESIMRGSLFRSAYELLFTPVPPAEKRAAKTLIDVACDRAGDALGGAIVQILMVFGASYLTSEYLGATLALAVVGDGRRCGWIANMLRWSGSAWLTEPWNLTW